MSATLFIMYIYCLSGRIKPAGDRRGQACLVLKLRCPMILGDLKARAEHSVFSGGVLF